MRTSHGVLAFGIFVSLVAFVSAQGLSGLYLDVGNDTDYEWNVPSVSGGPWDLEITNWVQRYARGGCWCVGCIHDITSGNCSVPVVVRADRIGNLTVDNVLFNYSSSRVIAEVGYGDSFKKAGGGCWDVRYNPGSPTFTGLFEVPPELGSCPETYVYDNTFTPIVTESAVNDAMARLLNGTLDTDEDGTCEFTEFNENYTFKTDGDIGVQTLWGPLKMRLVVWS